MDPNANLAEQRRIVGRWNSGELQPGDLERLAELAEALDEWLSGGGFLPLEWGALSREGRKGVPR